MERCVAARECEFLKAVRKLRSSGATRGLIHKEKRPVAKQGRCGWDSRNRPGFSDDNRNEHGAMRSSAGMRISESGAKAAQQRSNAGLIHKE